MDKGKPAPALSIFLLFFLLTPISPDCIKLPAVGCKAAQLAASHLNVARFDFAVVGLGFDITTMENAQGTVLDMNSWENPDGSCTVCSNTLLDGNPAQFLPLAITEWNITKADCSYYSYNTQPLSLTGLASHQTGYLRNTYPGLPNSYPSYISGSDYFIGSRSRILTDAQKQSVVDRRIFFPFEFKCKKYSVRTSENLRISEAFNESLKRLPQNYTTANKAVFMDLIRTYGTHYVEEAELGGVLRSAMSVRYCQIFLAGSNINEVRHCLTNDVNSVFGFGPRSDRICNRVNSLEKSCSSFSWGGNRINFCPAESNAEHLKKWLAELRISPGLITYILKPIFVLLPIDDPQYYNMEKAVYDYIRYKGMQIKCTNSCPSGKKPEFKTDCSCKCSIEDSLHNDDCCAREIGKSRVMVWVDRAEGLRADWFSEADAEVEVELFGVTKRTGYVWNSNYPVFNRYFDFGALTLIHGVNKFYVRVKEWNPWGEVITDRVEVQIGAGQIQEKTISLSHGRLRLRYQVVCASNLTGHNCREYKPQRATYEKNF